MTALLTLLRDICLFRAGPQDLPYAPAIAVRLVAVLLVLGLVAGWLQDLPAARWLPRGLVTLCTVVLVPWLLLALCRLRGRYVQTVSALAGVGVLYTVLALPLVGVLAPEPGPVGADPVVRPVVWALVALTLWRVLVHAHIWRHALAVPVGTGLVVAIGLFIAEVGVLHWLAEGSR